MFKVAKNVFNFYILAPIRKSLNDLLIVHALRPDRLLASVHLLVNSAFGSDFMQQDEVLNLQDIVANEVIVFVFIRFFTF